MEANSPRDVELWLHDEKIYLFFAEERNLQSTTVGVSADLMIVLFTDVAS